MSSRILAFTGAGGIELAAEAWGEPDGFPVLFFHGGGQTRHAWGGSAQRIAEAGFQAISVDLRGHGESAWSPEGDYSLNAFSEDCRLIAVTFETRPFLVGASLGGMSALRAEGAQDEDLSSGLVLVDIAPKTNPVGVARIQEFMESGIDGFDDLDQAAAAIAAYTPQRKRGVNYDGLKKVLRERDGRWYWHWDPAFMAPVRLASGQQNTGDPGVLGDPFGYMSRIHVPTLLVRGLLSDVVDDDGVRDLAAGVPQLEIVEVGGASHMIAGDKNDQFTDAVLSFLERSVPAGA